jgi:hypothetical protein
MNEDPSRPAAKRQAVPPPVHVDLPEVSEVYVDRLRGLSFDGHVLKLEFDVLRHDPAEGGGKGWLYTAARVVMSAGGVPDLLDQMTRFGEMLRHGKAEPPSDVDLSVGTPPAGRA